MTKIKNDYSRKTLETPQRARERIKNVFTNLELPGSFSGVLSVHRSVNSDGSMPFVSKGQVLKYLENEPAYTLHKQPVRTFSRRKVVVAGMNHQWQADLMDLSSPWRINKGYRYVLIVIDVFSKFVYARPLKSKRAPEILKAFQSIVSDSNVTPYRIQSDKGSEFINKHMKAWCSAQGIKLFTSEDDITKSQMAERVIRTIKKKILRQFVYRDNKKWVDVLDSLIKGYNGTYHSSIGMAPRDVNKTNEHEIFFKLYPPPGMKEMKIKSRTRGLKINDKVRLLNAKKLLKKEIYSQWTNEIFQIRIALPLSPIPVYKVESLSGEPILGFFYERELQRVSPKEFVINKRKRKKCSRTKCKVYQKKVRNSDTIGYILG